MASVLHSSRRRYEEYRVRSRQRRKEGAGGDAHVPAAGHGREDRHGRRRKRTRSFGALVRQFWGLLRGYRSSLIWIFIALSISTTLALAPLYGTKLVFDGVLREKPLPTGLPAWVPLPHERR
jgi:hypothetical protein